MDQDEDQMDYSPRNSTDPTSLSADSCYYYLTAIVIGL